MRRPRIPASLLRAIGTAGPPSTMHALAPEFQGRPWNRVARRRRRTGRDVIAAAMAKACHAIATLPILMCVEHRRGSCWSGCSETWSRWRTCWSSACASSTSTAYTSASRPAPISPPSLRSQCLSTAVLSEGRGRGAGREGIAGAGTPGPRRRRLRRRTPGPNRPGPRPRRRGSACRGWRRGGGRQGRRGGRGGRRGGARAVRVPVPGGRAGPGVPLQGPTLPLHPQPQGSPPLPPPSSRGGCAGPICVGDGRDGG